MNEFYNMNSASILKNIFAKNKGKCVTCAKNIKTRVTIFYKSVYAF